MKKQLAVGLAAAVAGAMSAGAFAGEEHGAEKPQMYSIYKEIVKPGMTQEYEAAIKNMIREFQQYQIDPEKIHWKCISGPEMGYVFVTPIEGWAGMETMHENWMEVLEILGEEKFKAMMKPAADAMERIEVFQVIKRSDLSYEPEKPRLTPEEVNYIHYGFYYVVPGQGDAIEQIAKDFVKLYKAKGVDTGFNIYESVTGSDLPVLVVAQGARSAADYYANRERIKTQLGEAAEQIGARIGTAVRKMKYADARPRPDLSFPAPEHMKKAAR